MLDIEKLKTLGWQPINPSELSKEDVGKDMYNVMGEKVWLKVPNLNHPEVFDYKQLSNYSLTPPTIPGLKQAIEMLNLLFVER